MEKEEAKKRILEAIALETSLNVGLNRSTEWLLGAPIPGARLIYGGANFLGSGAINVLAQKVRGEEDIKWGETFGAGATSLVPFMNPALTRAQRFVGRPNTLQRGIVGGAATGVVQEGIRIGVDEKRLPTPAETALGASIGGTFGGVTTGAISFAKAKGGLTQRILAAIDPDPEPVYAMGAKRGIPGAADEFDYILNETLMSSDDNKEAIEFLKQYRIKDTGNKQIEELLKTRYAGKYLTLPDGRTIPIEKAKRNVPGFIPLDEVLDISDKYGLGGYGAYHFLKTQEKAVTALTDAVTWLNKTEQILTANRIMSMIEELTETGILDPVTGKKLRNLSKRTLTYLHKKMSQEDQRIFWSIGHGKSLKQSLKEGLKSGSRSGNLELESFIDRWAGSKRIKGNPALGAREDMDDEALVLIRGMSRGLEDDFLRTYNPSMSSLADALPLEYSSIASVMWREMIKELGKKIDMSMINLPPSLSSVKRDQADMARRALTHGLRDLFRKAERLGVAPTTFENILWGEKIQLSPEIRRLIYEAFKEGVTAEIDTSISSSPLIEKTVLDIFK